MEEIIDKEIWIELYNKAKSVTNPRTISPFIEAGDVGSSILTEKGNIYILSYRKRMHEE